MADASRTLSVEDGERDRISEDAESEALMEPDMDSDPDTLCERDMLRKVEIE